MNVIEALVVTLGLDLTDFDKNDRRVNDALKKFTDSAEKRSKSFESAGKRAAETFGSLKTEILGAIAAFAGFKGLEEFVQGTTDTQAALGRLATNTNTSAATLKAWGVVAEEVGAKAEDAYGAFDKINQQLAQAAVTGSSPLLVMMRRLGITDVTNKSSIEDVLLKFSARLRELPRNQAQYAAGEAGLGGIFNELMLGPAELKKRLDQALGTLPASFDQSTKRAQELQKQMALVRAEFVGLKDNIWNQLEPAFQKLFQGVYDWMSRIDWGSVSRWIANLVPSVETLIGYVGSLNDASNGWLKTIGLLAAAWVVLNAVMAASPIGIVLLLAGALVALWNDYQTFQSGGKSLVDWKRWKDDASLAKDAVDTLTKALELLGKAYDKWKETIAGLESFGRSHVGAAFAQKAAAIESGQTPEQRRERGSPLHQLSQAVAYYFGYDPRTGARLSDQDLAGPPEASAATPDQGGGTPTGAVSGAFLDRVKQVESGGDPNAVSPRGALGAYQIEPSTGLQYGTSAADLRNPAKARVVAERYIDDLLKEFHGDLTRAMAAYNWGPGNVERHGLTRLPAETTAYLAKLGLPVTSAALGVAGASVDRSTASTQVGPIIVNVPPGADGARIASDLQQRLAQVHLPQAFTTGAE